LSTGETTAITRGGRYRIAEPENGKKRVTEKVKNVRKKARGVKKKRRTGIQIGGGEPTAKGGSGGVVGKVFTVKNTLFGK